MLSISRSEGLARALNSPIDSRLKQLLAKRVDQLGDDYPLDELVNFTVVTPGDTAADLEAAIGFSVFQNPADGSRWGEPDWTPGWEWIEDHGFAWELCFIMDDSGFGHVIVLVKSPAADTQLMRPCAEYASERV